MKTETNTSLKKFGVYEVSDKWPHDVDKGLLIFNYKTKSEQLIKHVYADTIEEVIEWLVESFDSWTILKNKAEPIWNSETRILTLEGVYPINDGPSFILKVKIIPDES